MTDDDPRDKRWQERGDRAYSDFTERPVRTGIKWYLWILAACIGLAIIGGAVSWVGSWGGEAKRVTSPQNVREQNTAIINDWESLTAAGDNVCTVGNPETGGDRDQTFTEDPTAAYKATYRKIRVDYNRRMANLYEAQAVRKLPLPSNLRSYPEVAPKLEEYLRDNCEGSG